MPGRFSTRARWICGGAQTTTTASQRRSPPVSKSSGTSSTTRSPARRLRAVRETPLGRGDARMEDALEPGAAPGGRRRRARPARAGRCRRLCARRRERSCATAATAAPPGASIRCTAASASNTGTPHAPEHRGGCALAHADRAGEAEDLHRCKRLQHRLAQRGRHLGHDAVPRGEARPALMQQHAEPVDDADCRARRAAARSGVSSGT